MLRMQFMYGHAGHDPWDTDPPARVLEQPMFHFDLVYDRQEGIVHVFRIANCIDEDIEGQELPFVRSHLDGKMAYVGEDPDFKGFRFPFKDPPDGWKPTANVGDVVVLYGRAGYDTPDPFSICSYVRQAYTHDRAGFFVECLVLLDGDQPINYYPCNEQLGDGYANWDVKIVHIERCGPDVIIKRGDLVFDRGASECPEEPLRNPMTWVANLTVLVDDCDLMDHEDVDSNWLGELLGIKED